LIARLAVLAAVATTFVALGSGMDAYSVFNR
jgi:hypothetical protein